MDNLYEALTIRELSIGFDSQLLMVERIDDSNRIGWLNRTNRAKDGHRLHTRISKINFTKTHFSFKSKTELLSFTYLNIGHTGIVIEVGGFDDKVCCVRNIKRV